MSQKSIMIVVGLGLLLVAIIFAGPVLADLVGGLMQGYSLSDWTWAPGELGRVVFGAIGGAIGLIVFLIGLSKKTDS
jgi:hypothetical protein